MANSKSQRVYHRLTGMIRTGFKVGQRFLTVRELAQRERISMQTAHNLMKRLREEGLLDHRPPGVSVVKSLPAHATPYRIAIVIPGDTGWFQERFLDGFMAGFGNRAPRENLVLLDTEELGSADALEAIAAQGHDGIIGVSVHNAWPLYALHRLGQRVLANLPAAAVWPSMPVTCVDFHATAQAAGQLLREYGHRRACIAGPLHAAADPEAFARGFRGESVSVIRATDLASEMVRLRSVLRTENPTAIYLADKNVIPSVLSVLASEKKRVPADISLVTHDGNPETYDGFTVLPISSVGPSIQAIGKALALRMCRMLDGTAASEPALQYLPPSVYVTGSIRRLSPSVRESA